MLCLLLRIQCGAAEYRAAGCVSQAIENRDTYMQTPAPLNILNTRKAA